MKITCQKQKPPVGKNEMTLVRILEARTQYDKPGYRFEYESEVYAIGQTVGDDFSKGSSLHQVVEGLAGCEVDVGAEIDLSAMAEKEYVVTIEQALGGKGVYVKSARPAK